MLNKHLIAQGVYIYTGEAHAAEAESPVLAPAPPLEISENVASVKEEDVPPVL